MTNAGPASYGGLMAGIVNTAEYYRAHASIPRGFGTWRFRSVATGETAWYAGDYTAVRRALPAGIWVVLA